MTFSTDEDHSSGDAVARLLEYWRSRGVPILPGSHEHEIAEFERRHRVVLPPDLREFVRQCGGIGGDTGEADARDFRGLIEFWPLHSYESLATRYRHEEQLSLGPWDSRQFFIFADFSLHSHHYAIRLSPDSGAPTPVLLYAGPRYAHIVGNSFSDFVWTYLTDPVGAVRPQTLSQMEG